MKNTHRIIIEKEDSNGMATAALVLGSATVLYKFGFWIVLIIFSMATEY